MASNLQTKEILCNLCEENSACFWCKTCTQNMCRICQKGHAKTMKDHEILSFAERSKEENADLISEHAQLSEKVKEFENFLEGLRFTKAQQEEHLKDIENCIDGFVRKVTAFANAKKTRIQETFKKLEHGKITSKVEENLEKAKNEVRNFNQLIDTNPVLASEKLDGIQGRIQELTEQPYFETCHCDVDFAVFNEDCVRVMPKILYHDAKKGEVENSQTLVR